MSRKDPSPISRYFRRAAADLLAACDGRDSPSPRSGRHLFPVNVKSGIDRLADTGARLGPGTLPALRRKDLKGLMSLVERPVFLGGVHGSGATLLSNLWDGHESLAVLPYDGGFDPAFLRRISTCSLRERHRRLYRRMVEKAVGRLAGPLRWLYEVDGEGRLPVEELSRWTGYFSRAFDSSPGGLLRVVAASFAAVSGQRLPGRKRYWVYKATLNVPAAARLYTLFPEARFVEIQRDSRAVYASQRRKARLKGRPFRPYHELLCLHEWQRASGSNRRLMGEDRYRVIRYEDLVSDCGPVMGDAAAFLGIPTSPALCEPSVTGEPVAPGTVSPPSLERWRAVLDPGEVSMLEHFSSPLATGLAGRVADHVVTARHLVKIQKGGGGEEMVKRLSPLQFLSVLAMRRKGPAF